MVILVRNKEKAKGLLDGPQLQLQPPRASQCFVSVVLSSRACDQTLAARTLNREAHCHCHALLARVSMHYQAYRSTGLQLYKHRREALI